MFGVIVVEEAHLPGTDTILLVTYFTVGLSVLLHGVTAAPLAARYGDWYRSKPKDDLPPMESVSAPAHRAPFAKPVQWQQSSVATSRRL